MTRSVALVSPRYVLYHLYRRHFANKSQDLIRISVGIEHIDDIIADFEQSFKAASDATTKGEKTEIPAGGKEAEAPLAP
jgi:hypothetical protein